MCLDSPKIFPTWRASIVASSSASRSIRSASLRSSFCRTGPWDLRHALKAALRAGRRGRHLLGKLRILLRAVHQWQDSGFQGCCEFWTGRIIVDEKSGGDFVL
jgi:hypothetical protein